MNKVINFFVLDVTLKGGIERFVVNMANSLAKKGYHVKIYSFHRTNDSPLYFLDNHVEVEYMTSLPFRGGIYKLITFYCCFKLSIKSAFNWKDSECISTHPITTIFISWLSKPLLHKIIASEHSSYSSHGALISWLRAKAYKHAKAIVTQSDDGISKFLAKGLSSVKIYNPTTNFMASKQWDIDLIKEKTEFVCLSVARFEPVKQLQQYIDVAKIVHAQHPSIKFQLVGDGSCLEQLQAKIQKEGLNHCFTIFSPTENVNVYYEQASVYIITSKSEAFPMTMIESLSFATPVISYSDLVGPKEVIDNGKNGFLCEQGNTKEIAEKIIELYSDESKKLSMMQGALESSTQFKDENIISLWEGIFN